MSDPQSPQASPEPPEGTRAAPVITPPTLASRLWNVFRWFAIGIFALGLAAVAGVFGYRAWLTHRAPALEIKAEGSYFIGSIRAEVFPEPNNAKAPKFELPYANAVMVREVKGEWVRVAFDTPDGAFEGGWLRARDLTDRTRDFDALVKQLEQTPEDQLDAREQIVWRLHALRPGDARVYQLGLPAVNANRQARERLAVAQRELERAPRYAGIALDEGVFPLIELRVERDGTIRLQEQQLDGTTTRIARSAAMWGGAPARWRTPDGKWQDGAVARSFGGSTCDGGAARPLFPGKPLPAGVLLPATNQPGLAGFVAAPVKIGAADAAELIADAGKRLVAYWKLEEDEAAKVYLAHLAQQQVSVWRMPIGPGADWIFMQIRFDNPGELKELDEAAVKALREHPVLRTEITHYALIAWAQGNEGTDLAMVTEGGEPVQPLLAWDIDANGIAELITGAGDAPGGEYTLAVHRFKQGRLAQIGATQVHDRCDFGDY